MIKAWLKRNSETAIAIVVTALFLVACWLMYVKGVAWDIPWLLIVPAALLGISLFVLKLDTALMVMALLTPFAIDVAIVQDMELSMPVEPMMILYTAIFLFRVLLSGEYDRRILRHPVTLSVFGMLLWMLFTSFTSQMPLVSFKYLAARLWFMVPFFFSAALLFQRKEKIGQLLFCYLISLVAVICYATVRKLQDIYDLQLMYIVMQPFYNDHTAYGCIVALMLPVTFHYMLRATGRPVARALLLVACVALCVGLFFSYCRAAWISVLAAIVIYVAVRIGIKMKWLFLFAALGVGAFFVHQTEVVYNLGKNTQDSSLNLGEQLKSISNISTDASNLERLNRWASAMRMFEERPLLGCGPGTYQFLYGSYQISYQLTTISTNSGNRGNAHSEYIGPMTEQGIPGVVFVVLVFVSTFLTGVRIYRTAKDKASARLALGLTLSLLTYYVHGFFNNFLDTDKLSVPFWAMTAARVALDITTEKEEQPIENQVAERKDNY